MAKTIEAVFEKGVLKPLHKIRLPEHTTVTVIIKDTERKGKEKRRRTSLKSIFDIAKNCSDKDLSVRHDHALYGE